MQDTELVIYDESSANITRRKLSDCDEQGFTKLFADESEGKDRLQIQE